jgi:protein KTI12
VREYERWSEERAEEGTTQKTYHHFIMPLIILTGPPSVGKTVRAVQLKHLLESRIDLVPKGPNSQETKETHNWIPEFVEELKVQRVETVHVPEVHVEKQVVKPTSSFKLKKKIVLASPIASQTASDEWELAQAVKEQQQNGFASMAGMTTSPSLPSSSSSNQTSAIDFSLLQQSPSKTGWTVHIVNEESVMATRREAYSAIKSENLHRGTLLSAVTRLLSENNVVIADSINGIKGFRYQLYLVAKAIPTQTCCVRVVADGPSLAWNEGRNNGYTQDQFNDLLMRYEEPSPSTRWDSPLITMFGQDIEDSFSQVVQALFHVAPPRPNIATVITPVSDTTYLQNVDKVLDDLCRVVFRALPICEETTLVLPYSQDSVTLTEDYVKGWTWQHLQRMKKHWQSLNRLHTISAQTPLEMDKKVAKSFGDFLQNWK